MVTQNSKHKCLDTNKIGMSGPKTSICIAISYNIRQLLVKDFGEIGNVSGLLINYK